MVLVADPRAAAPDGQWFNVSAVKAPLANLSPNGIGTASKAPIYGPGLNNWDISLFKNFRLGSNEARRMQFRFETYNTFNHTQYNAIDTGARFDQNKNQTNLNYGRFSGVGKTPGAWIEILLLKRNGLAREVDIQFREIINYNGPAARRPVRCS